jgi:hypothetical protein
MNEAQTHKPDLARGGKKPNGGADARASYVNLSAELAKLEAKLTRQRADVTKTEEALSDKKKAITAALAGVK